MEVDSEVEDGAKVEVETEPETEVEGVVENGAVIEVETEAVTEVVEGEGHVEDEQQDQSVDLRLPTDESQFIPVTEVTGGDLPAANQQPGLRRSPRIAQQARVNYRETTVTQRRRRQRRQGQGQRQFLPRQAKIGISYKD